MKTIELICGGAKTQFTTRSVTINGIELFYSKMSDVSHNADECYYTFTYNGKSVKLPYEEKDSRILGAIFNQVIMLTEKKTAAKSPTASSEASEAEPAPVPASPEPSEDDISETAADIPEKQDEDEDKKETVTDTADSAAADSRHTQDPVRQARLKKSLIVFGIIIIIFAAAAAITYFFFGTSDAPSNMAPNSTESQQYDDIDDIINDLQ